MTSEPTGMFDAFYYATGCGRPYQRDDGWLSLFNEIASQIVSRLQPSSALDAGCAWGFLVEALRQRGVQAYGVDISDYAIANVHPDIKPFCWVGSITEPYPQQYDLIVSIEVLEHMQPAEAEKAVGNFCRSGSGVLFSSTPFDYKEATHFNVQPPEYWGELFARYGFFRDVDFDASFITPWAVYFRPQEKPLPRHVRDYERRFFLLWKENVDLRSLSVELRGQLSETAQQLKQTQEQVTTLEAVKQDFAAAVKAATARAVELDHEAAIARLQLEEIHRSRLWRGSQSLVRLREGLAPYGSRRERLLQKIGLLSRKG